MIRPRFEYKALAGYPTIGDLAAAASREGERGWRIVHVVEHYPDVLGTPLVAHRFDAIFERVATGSTSATMPAIKPEEGGE